MAHVVHDQARAAGEGLAALAKLADVVRLGIVIALSDLDLLVVFCCDGAHVHLLVREDVPRRVSSIQAARTQLQLHVLRLFILARVACLVRCLVVLPSQPLLLIFHDIVGCDRGRVYSPDFLASGAILDKITFFVVIKSD